MKEIRIILASEAPPPQNLPKIRTTTPIGSTEDRERKSQIARQLWQDPEYRAKMLRVRSDMYDKSKASRSEAMKRRWQDSEYRTRISQSRRKQWQNPATREKTTSSFRKVFNTPEQRAKRSQNAFALWDNPEFRLRMVDLRRKLYPESTLARINKGEKAANKEPHKKTHGKDVYLIADDSVLDLWMYAKNNNLFTQLIDSGEITQEEVSALGAFFESKGKEGNLSEELIDRFSLVLANFG